MRNPDKLNPPLLLSFTEAPTPARLPAFVGLCHKSRLDELRNTKKYEIFVSVSGSLQHQKQKLCVVFIRVGVFAVCVGVRVCGCAVVRVCVCVCV